MIGAVAFLAGASLGSVPTAIWLGRAMGVNLRDGTGNPGTNNAWRLGGRRLAAAVLFVEMAKGFGAVWLGRRIASDPGAALAGIGATVGNIYNPWLKLKGGKGLAIAGGTILAAWPAMVPLLIVVMAAIVVPLKRTGPAALLALGVYGLVAALGMVVELPGRWLVERPVWALALAAGSIVVVTPKHYVDSVKRTGPRGSPG